MGHRRGNPVICLKVSDEGLAELTSDTVTLWAMDSDPDFVEEFGQDLLERGPLSQDDVDQVLDYLVDARVLSEAQTTHIFVEQPDAPADTDTDTDTDDDDDEDDEEDTDT